MNWSDGDSTQGKAEEKKFNSTALTKFADVDKDGKLSIYEYFLVTSFIKMQRSQCSQFFKDNNLVDLDSEALRKCQLFSATNIFKGRLSSFSLRILEEDSERKTDNFWRCAWPSQVLHFEIRVR